MPGIGARPREPERARIPEVTVLLDDQKEARPVRTETKIHHSITINPAIPKKGYISYNHRAPDILAFNTFGGLLIRVYITL